MARPPRLALHTLVLGLFGLLSAPLLSSGAAPASLPADPAWDQARQADRGGDLSAALRQYQALAQAGSPQAQLQAARAALDDQDPATATTLLADLLQRTPRGDDAASATFLLARARHQAGDCPGALRALDTLEPTRTLGPYPALLRATCAADLEDWTAALKAATAALATDGGVPRLARIDALERAATANQKLGRPADAYDLFNQALDLAGTREYRAEMRYTTATLAHTLGRDDLAAERYRAVVVDTPDLPRAADALDGLNDLGRGSVVSPYQAALARLGGRDYTVALALFDQEPADSPNAGLAHLGRATALQRLDRSDEALTELLAVPDLYPEQAATALVRAGRLLESLGRPADAEAAYLRVTTVPPNPDRMAEGLLRAGLLRYLRDDVLGALDLWSTAAAAQPSPALRAEVQLWRGKVFARVEGDGSAHAHNAWMDAAGAAPDSYFGVRAHDLLDGITVPLSTGPRPVATLTPTFAETQARTSWLALSKLTAPSLATEVAATSGLQRAEMLATLGLRDEAGWELDGLMRQYAQAKDLPRLNALGDWAASHDLPDWSMRIGGQARDLLATGQSQQALPLALQKQLFPAGWGDLAFQQANAQGLDPLLLLALVRQESSFQAQARSNASALGLTQVVPSTGQEVARRLGQADTFQARDLLKPATSLQYGAVYLATLLRQYDGRLIPALAAYNGGGGNVNRWLARFGDDPDMLVEQIPFAETQTYLERVYENYRAYTRLYAS